MILITGGSGFIGSNVIEALNRKGVTDILVADEMDNSSKWKNLNGKAFADLIDRRDLFLHLDQTPVEAVIHLGACTDTTETDASKMLEANYFFSKRLWSYCADKKIKLIYASSAAVYGDGCGGFGEDRDMRSMRPLNLYGFSKLIFDQYATTDKNAPPVWAGLRFFNVYGPGEEHKGKMASMAYQMYRQIQDDGKVRLYKSYHRMYPDGEQARDFIYVKDVANMILYLLGHNHYASGLYNIGTGETCTFQRLAETVFSVCGKPVNIEYVEMPNDLRFRYQYYTKSDTSKLKRAGYTEKLISVREGISECIPLYERDVQSC